MNISVGNDFELSIDSTTYKNTWTITPDVDGNIGTTKLFTKILIDIGQHLPILQVCDDIELRLKM